MYLICVQAKAMEITQDLEMNRDPQKKALTVTPNRHSTGSSMEAITIPRKYP
jgi:hypothetical protein